MQISTPPTSIVLPFANAGIKNTIPVAPGSPGVANYTEGFPAICAQPISAGGIPPDMGDFNGLLFNLTQTARWSQVGGTYQWNGTFAAAVGGYPAGAVLLSADGSSTWFNVTDNNTTNPDSGGSAGWVPFVGQGITSVALAASNVTLTTVQYEKPVIALNGILTANVVVSLPNVPGRSWLISNNTTGAFSLTIAMLGGGSSVVLQQGALAPILVTGTGTTLALPLTSQTGPGLIQIASLATVNAITNFIQAVTPSTLGQGFEILTSGANVGVRLPQWMGSLIVNAGQTPTIAPAGTFAVTFQIPFPNALWSAVICPTLNGITAAAQSWAQTIPTGAGPPPYTGLTVGNTQNGTLSYFYLAFGK